MKRSELRELYIQEADITEHRFAMKHFGTWKDWLSYVASNEAAVTQWRKELELKLRGEAYRVVIETSRYGGKDALQAAKFLLQKGVLSRDGTSEVTEEEVIEQVKKPREQVDNDYLRLIVNSA